MTGFKLQNLSQSFGSQKVLQNLNLNIQPGEFVALVGPSGCGKTTLLRILADLQKPTSGEVIFETSPRRAFVFQNANLLPWRNVEENVGLPLELEKKLETQKQIFRILSDVSLKDAEKLFPHELSGGMQMRTSIARALVSSPDLLLLDEPFSALDEISRFELQEQLRKIWSEKRMTVFFVTHSLSEAVFMADRVLLLKNGSIADDRKINFEVRSADLRENSDFNTQVRDLARELRA
jgi:NitT/TauT family transport system ATP-binding protein